MNLKDRAYKASEYLRNAYNALYEELVGIINENGGLIDTRACDDKPTLFVVQDCTGGDSAYGETETVPIHAICYNVEDGQIYILTNTELDSYAYDNNYYFENYYDFEGEDKTHFEDAIKDITYFRELNDGYTDMRSSIFNIISGLYAYIK